METKLKLLFDYQKFGQNADLKSVIDSVHARYTRQELSLDDAEWVAAAGVPNLYPKDGDKQQKGQ